MSARSLVILLLLALGACRNPGRWNNPAGGIPPYPGAPPEVGYVRAVEPPCEDAGEEDADVRDTEPPPPLEGAADRDAAAPSADGGEGDAEDQGNPY